MTSTNKTKYKIKNKGYSNRSGQFRHDNGEIAFGESEKNDEYIQSKRDKAKKWLTEESADKLLKEVREKKEEKK